MIRTHRIHQHIKFQDDVVKYMITHHVKFFFADAFRLYDLRHTGYIEREEVNTPVVFYRIYLYDSYDNCDMKIYS